ncbi:AraC family transcriptional regulator, partial [Xanthomonas citri pv. citri]|nr:AraC family transcriptional regulator [Xanthomonas citri pv. citri]
SWLKTFLAKIDEIREKSSGKSELVLLAVRYIKNHCLESLRLETVAEELAVSPNYLSTIIKKETGITFQQHMIQEKLNIARKLLDDT